MGSTFVKRADGWENCRLSEKSSLRSWRDIARECFFSRRTGSREHEWRSRERIGEESSWIPACPNSLGFLNYAFTSVREFRIGWEYWNVNQMLIDTSHLSQGKRFVFIQGECEEEMHRGSISIARYAFKSSRICYRGAKYEINREQVACILYCSPGPGCDYRDCLQLQ